MASPKISVRLPSDLLSWLTQHAADQELSVSQVVVAALRAYRELSDSGPTRVTPSLSDSGPIRVTLSLSDSTASEPVGQSAVGQPELSPLCAADMIFAEQGIDVRCKG